MSKLIMVTEGDTQEIADGISISIFIYMKRKHGIAVKSTVIADIIKCSLDGIIDGKHAALLNDNEDD